MSTEYLTLLDRVVLDLHFDACWFQPDKDPGLWRTGPIGVTGADRSLDYGGPDAEEVPGLMVEVLAWPPPATRTLNSALARREASGAEGPGADVRCLSCHEP